MANLRDQPQQWRSYQVPMLVAVGFFVTTLGQPSQVGGLPLRLLLKDQLHISAGELATFFAVAAFAWYLKPIAGLLCDAVPVFGSRRKSYLILSTASSVLIWLSLGLVRQSYNRLLILVVGLNATIVLASTVLGGIMVEFGQQTHTTGQLVSWKFIANNTAALVVGPIAGYLAVRSIVITSWTGALILSPLALAGILVLRSEDELGISKKSVYPFHEIKLLVTNKGLILATAFIFLVGIEPGFDTPLLYFQTDTLHFSAKLLGWLALVRGATGLASAAFYGFFCSRLKLVHLLVLGVLLHAAGSLAYLYYASTITALIIEGVYGFCYTLAVLPVFDLAARATPKGCEAMGLAMVMSLWNVANAISDVSGSWLFDKHGVKFVGLVWLNATTTLCVLLFVRMVPRPTLQSRSTGET